MFSEGREDVNDEERAGRPSTSTTDEKINEVEKMILANGRITVREVAEDLNISIGSCHSIFINDFGMRRVAAKFVPKLLNCDQKQHRMNIANEMLDSVREDPNLLQRVITGDGAWVYGYDVETKAQSSQWKLPHEPRPKKARQVRSNVKVLLTFFFDCRGVVHHAFLPQGRTVNKEYYLQVMRNLREAIRQKRPDLWKNKNWLLHHDNAPAHTSLLVRDFLAKNNTLMMPQPPYSPDLAPLVISEPKSAHLREVLLFAFNWKKSATEAHRMLEEVHGDHSLSKSQCYRWLKKFQSGDFELDNEPRGKPHQKFEDAELQALLDDDSTQTQEKLAKQLQVSQGSVSLRLNSLRMTQKLSRKVPHELSERQQERRLVTCEGLLARHEKKSFLNRIVTSDEKSIHFSNSMRQKSWGLLGQFPKLRMTQKLSRKVPHELSERQQERRLVTCEGLLARHEKKSFLNRIVTSDEKSIHFSNSMRQKSWGLLGQFPKRQPRPNRLGKKAMLCVWWDQTGVIHFKLLKPGETVNTSRYEHQMHSLREAVNEKRPELREKHNKLILQHDNALAHNATVVKNTIKDLGWELLPHPPYSPDLAPSDYHLFTSLGHALKNQEFSNSDILRKWLVDWFDSKGIEFFRQGIRKLPE
ncbi:hypothetical protein LAZ67_15001423, partial [Cordylochernes scorpioides]